MFLLILEENKKLFLDLVFTFHDVSINTERHFLIRRCKCYFTFHDVSINTFLPLHIFYFIISFTFHDVSINTCRSGYKNSIQTALHSTMFLLIQFASKSYTEIVLSFTFHDVSINTSFQSSCPARNRNSLHSTMFLLIPDNDHYCPAIIPSLHSTMFLLIPVVYSSLQYRYNLTTFCQSCHFIIFILIFIFLDSSHF